MRGWRGAGDLPVLAHKTESEGSQTFGFEVKEDVEAEEEGDRLKGRSHQKR